MAFYQNLIKGGKGAQAGDMRVEQRLNEAGAGRGAQGTAAEGYATGGVVGKTPNPKIPNPPFKPFGTKPGATPA
jgi:hypothetical protein